MKIYVDGKPFGRKGLPPIETVDVYTGTRHVPSAIHLCLARRDRAAVEKWAAYMGVEVQEQEAIPIAGDERITVFARKDFPGMSVTVLTGVPKEDNG